MFFNANFSPLDSELAVQRLRLGSVVPKEEDLHGSAQALIRLQDVYELDINSLAHGTVGNKKTGARLSAQVKKKINKL